MRIASISSRLLENNADLIICASGYEERCTHYVDQLDLSTIANKVALCFSDSGIGSKEKYTKNIEYFVNHNFSLEYPSNENRVIDILERYLKNIEKEDLVIRIDYSSMRRFWYSDLLLLVSHKTTKFKSVKLQFVYSIYTLAAEGEMHGVEEIYPMNGFSKLTIPDKPTALLLGVGAEKGVPQYVKEFFNADCIHYFYTDNDFAPSIEDVHKEHFEEESRFCLHRYNLNDGIKLIQEMSEVCKTLYSDYRIVILPCGPKPFTLYSLLLSTIVPNVEVWYLKMIKSYPNELEASNSNTLSTEVLFLSE